MTQSQAAALGAFIRAGRHQVGIGTHRLAAQVGVNQSRLIRLEQGKVLQPEPALLQKLSAALDLPLTQLYEMAGIRMPGLQPYLRASYGLTEKDAAKAQAYVDRLAARYGADGSGPADGLDEQPDKQDH